MPETIDLDFADGVEIVTLNRPPVNAVNSQMMAELIQTFSSYEARGEVRAVVLAGNGTKAFCSGLDLKDLNKMQQSDLSIKDQIDPGWQWRLTQRAIRHSMVPVICALEAPAIGAGFSLAAISDFIIASTSARFALTEINVGLLGGGSKAMKLMGAPKAKYMIYTGEMIRPEELHRVGAIERVVEPGQALQEALTIAKLIASKSPLAVRMAKQAILRIETDAIEEESRTEADHLGRLRQFEDSGEALSAFLEKRPPHFNLR